MIEIEGLPQLTILVSRRTHVTVIDFYADWCGPCREIKPHYERLAQYYDAGKVTFCKCNTDRNQSCAQTYNVTAMPTFVVCFGGEVIQTIRGGDMGSLQRAVDIGVGMLPRTDGQRLGGGASSTASPAATTTTQDPFGERMMAVSGGVQANDPIAVKDNCSAAYDMLMSPGDATQPAGFVLLSYLASEAYSCVALDALLRNTRTRDAISRDDGSYLVNQVLRYVVEVACASTWEDMSTVLLLHRVVCALARSTEAQTIMARSPFFYSALIVDGTRLERTTVLGALLGVGHVPRAYVVSPAMPNSNHHMWHSITLLFPPERAEEHGRTVDDMQHRMNELVQINHRTVKALLDSKTTREVTLKFFGAALRLNEDYQKTMHDSSVLSTRVFMTQLQSMLIELALPVVDRSASLQEIPASYLLDDPRNPVLVRFGQGGDVERVRHYDVDNPLPQLPPGGEVAPYKPFVHLFFLAARAVTLCANVLIDEHIRDNRNATHPQVPLPQRALYRAEMRFIEGLIGSSSLGSKRLHFLNGLARWLLQVMGPNHSGYLADSPPAEWNYLPQQLVDCTIRATQMAPLDAVFLDHLIAFMLVLMGNTTYFPKPHTQVLFPTFLVRLMEDFDGKAALERHTWFTEHIVRGCVHCYMAVERSTYEKVQVRFELSHCIKTFLKFDTLCQPVRAEFEQKAEVLERFSHMAVSDVNEAVDQLIDMLTKMHALEQSGADLSEGAVAPPSNGRPGSGQPHQGNGNRNRHGNNGGEGGDSSSSDNEGVVDGENTDTMTYHQMGQSLKSHIMLFNALIDMFIQLSIQFPKGVSQNMVAQQISQMLARSLVIFAGPKNSNLKITHAARYNFEPRAILSRLVDCFTHFRHSKGFLRCLCTCGVPLEDLRGALRNIVDRLLVGEALSGRLAEMATALDAVAKAVDSEGALWDEAPDFAMDALLATPLTNPVALPAEVKDLEDLVYVNRDTIHHYLLSGNKHPYTNEYLDEDMVDAFNTRPEIVAAREQLQRRIHAWLAEARK